MADLHYRDVCEWAVGRNAAAGWSENDEISDVVTRVWTDPLPTAEVERVAPNEDAELTDNVTFGMETLAKLADTDATALHGALVDLPSLYGVWIDSEMEVARDRIEEGIRLLVDSEKARSAFKFMNLAVADAARHRIAGTNGAPEEVPEPVWRAFILLRQKLAGLPPLRRETGERLITEMEVARDRIEEGIRLLVDSEKARSAFKFMNLAVADAARHRIAGTNGAPEEVPEPVWRPFQLAVHMGHTT